jgi:hypothetical protein
MNIEMLLAAAKDARAKGLSTPAELHKDFVKETNESNMAPAAKRFAIANAEFVLSLPKPPAFNVQQDTIYRAGVLACVKTTAAGVSVHLNNGETEEVEGDEEAEGGSSFFGGR